MPVRIVEGNHTRSSYTTTEYLTLLRQVFLLKGLIKDDEAQYPSKSKYNWYQRVNWMKRYLHDRQHDGK